MIVRRNPKGPLGDANAFEIYFAKEARERERCWGKPLDCSKIEAFWGLECGLSGNPALFIGNGIEPDLKGNRGLGDGFVSVWETLLDLSCKIYSLCCHRKAFR